MIDIEKVCGKCKNTIPFPSDKPTEEISLMCMSKDTGFYKVCGKTLACDYFVPADRMEEQE